MFFSDPGKDTRVEPGECLGDYRIIQGRKQDVYILMIGKIIFSHGGTETTKKIPIITKGFPPL
jgi:hypothetical protein